MRFLLVLFIALSPYPEGQTVLTGVISINDEVLPGCSVRLIGSEISTSTDSDGKFVLTLPATDKGALEITYLEDLTTPVVIEEIDFGGGQIDFGIIPLVYNKTISTAEYRKLDAGERLTYLEMRHWTEVSGYISKTTADTANLRKVYGTERKVDYAYDPAGNRVVIRFRDWSGGSR